MDKLTLQLATDIVSLARQAGRAILDVYGQEDFNVTIKEDSSPLTEADRRSHEIIVKGLAKLTPDIPVMSEEGKEVPYEARKDWNRFYLVDPLDGTKEFVKRNGEFTVNIAIIEEGRPSLGVLYIPVTDKVYYAAEDQGAYRQVGSGKPERISATEHFATEPLVVVASRSHGSEALEAFLTRLTVKNRVTSGSALKFSLVAEGKADIYPRFGPTWEWDTAAGHAIVLEAGGRVVDTGMKKELQYNKPSLKHQGFIVAPTVLIASL